MKINVMMDELAQGFLEELKRKYDELIVPLDSWIAYIRDNPSVKEEDLPQFIETGGYVITEREWFGDLVKELGNIYYEPKRLPKQEGGFWFVLKLESKKKMPKHDFFDVGIRQPGSFRSNG